MMSTHSPYSTPSRQRAHSPRAHAIPRATPAETWRLIGALSLLIIGTLLVLSMLAAPAHGKSKKKSSKRAVPAEDMVEMLFAEPGTQRKTLRTIHATWQPGYTVMLVELLGLSRDLALTEQLIDSLEQHTGQTFGRDLKSWYDWIWSQEIEPHPQYAQFKNRFYRNIDPHFGRYFTNDPEPQIRLDEVRWGGVHQDGIPPLRDPKMIRADAAGYLEDDHIVFGLEVNGDARAYPKRILAWHEMFTDTIAGVPVAGVYCTLCGTVLLYETNVDGTQHEIGTSGFLYRSNKLMYDRATQSLWNTLWGRPVIGPLVGKGIELPRRSVVTTTWGEWRRRHPDTTALSLDTGHRRDYGEGVAYREYFATDELMFTVPKLDRRLKNKAEVLTFHPRGDNPALAISADFLMQHPIHIDTIGDVQLVILTDRSGANRAYQTQGQKFVEWDQDHTAVDDKGQEWTLSESALSTAEGTKLSRYPAQRAFWFGWYAAYPSTRLVSTLGATGRP